MPAPLLDVRHLSVVFGSGPQAVDAVKDVSFQIAPGETLGLVGESGSGKSVTAFAIVRLLQSQGRVIQGSILFESLDLLALPEREMRQIRGARISLIFQEPMTALNPVTRVGDQIAEALTVHGHSRQKANDRAVELLNAVHVPQAARRARDYPPHQLSGGMRQRVMIAVALACHPALVIADEPTTALDVTIQAPDRTIIWRGGVSRRERARVFTRGDAPGRRDMQIVFQDPYASLNPRMRAGDIVEEPLVIHAIGSKSERLTRVEELFSLVGLEPDHRTRYPHEFSGGQRQRIGIARALALNPAFIIADEAVSALDVSIQAQVITRMMDLKERFKLTFLFIAHDLRLDRDVEHLCNRIAVMYRGKIVEMGDTASIFSSPRHPYTRALLRAVPVLDPDAPRRRITLDTTTVDRDAPLMEVEPGHWVAA